MRSTTTVDSPSRHPRSSRFQESATARADWLVAVDEEHAAIEGECIDGIGPSGPVARARIAQGPTAPEVERAVVRALAGWRFEPARERGTREPVAVRFAVSPALALPATRP